MGVLSKFNAGMYLLFANSGLLTTISGAGVVIWADDHYKSLGVALGIIGIIVQIVFGILKHSENKKQGLETKRHNKAMEPQL